jgi:hypothetical protein
MSELQETSGKQDALNSEKAANDTKRKSSARWAGAVRRMISDRRVQDQSDKEEPDACLDRFGNIIVGDSTNADF